MKSCSFIAGNTKFYQDTVLGSDERNVCRHYKGSHWQGDLFACHMITCLTGLISLGFLPLCVISSLSYRTSTINCFLNLKVLCICFLVHHCIFLQVHVDIQLSTKITDTIYEETISEFIRETANTLFTEELSKKRSVTTTIKHETSECLLKRRLQSIWSMFFSPQNCSGKRGHSRACVTHYSRWLNRGVCFSWKYEDCGGGHKVKES